MSSGRRTANRADRSVITFWRYPGETIEVGGITIRVVGMQPSKVRLSIEAPRHVAVDRGEIRADKDRDAA